MLDVPENVKKQYRRDSVPKNMRIHFPGGELQDITNENIVSESVTLTESLCSRDNLKFGLCEASVFECELAGIEKNISGCNIVVTQEIPYEDDAGNPQVYSMPYGTFTIASCKRQADMSRRKVVAYDGLYKGNLDTDVSDIINDVIKTPWKYADAIEDRKEKYRSTVYMIERTLFELFHIKHDFGATILTFGDNLIHEYNIHTTSSGKYFSDSTYLEVYVSAGAYDEYLKVIADSQLDAEIRSSVDAFLLGTEIPVAEQREILEDNGYCFCTIGESKVNLDEINGKEYATEDETSFTILTKISVYAVKGITSTLIKTLDFGRNASRKKLEQYIICKKINLSGAEKAIVNKPQDKVTLRKILQSVFELSGKFGKINRRTGEMEAGKFNIQAIYPALILYPKENIYPAGTNETVLRSGYMKLWHEEYGVAPFGKIKAKYKKRDITGKEEDAICNYVFNAEAKNTYTINDNWVLQSGTLIMEPYAVELIIRDMAKNIGNTAYMPFNATAKGMPYMEAGDSISFVTGSGGIQSFVFKRILKGIQGLTDSVEASGDEINKDITVKGE